MCVDKVKQNGGKPGCDYYYIIHVIDPSGKLSYNRSEIKSDSSIQLVQKDQVLMWMGAQRKDGKVPAFCFYICEQTVIEGIKGVLTKALFETNHMQMFAGSKKSSESDTNSEAGADQQWLEAQLCANNGDTSMLDQSKEENEDFDLTEF